MNAACLALKTASATFSCRREGDRRVSESQSHGACGMFGTTAHPPRYSGWRALRGGRRCGAVAAPAAGRRTAARRGRLYGHPGGEPGYSGGAVRARPSASRAPEAASARRRGPRAPPRQRARRGTRPPPAARVQPGGARWHGRDGMTRLLGGASPAHNPGRFVSRVVRRDR